MKLNRLETHDRYQHFTKQQFDISECCQNLINQRPFGNHPFYIFAHARTDDDGVTKRLIWQPRLTKPKAQTNSMLFKAYPGTDILKVIWMIPDRALWKQYGKGLVTENKTVIDSIYAFEHNREELERKESDDLTDIQIDQIYKDLSKQGKTKQKTSVVSSNISVLQQQN
jgi:hypothetical protein